MTKGHERVAITAEGSPGVCQVRFDEMKRKRIVPGGDRRVRRKDGRPPNFVERRIERLAMLDEIANALKDDKRGVALIEVPRDRRRSCFIRRDRKPRAKADTGIGRLAYRARLHPEVFQLHTQRAASGPCARTNPVGAAHNRAITAARHPSGRGPSRREIIIVW